MKNLIYIISMLFISSMSFGQNAICDEAFEIPYTFSYSGFILFQEYGQVNTDDFRIRASIVEESPDGNILFSEGHDTPFQKTGFFNLEIGSISPKHFIDVLISMNEAQTKDYYILVELYDGSDYVTIGSKLIQTVPYALVANSLEGIGPRGVDGFDCWDSNKNGMTDANEDVNSDGTVDNLDCQGATGPIGSTGAVGSWGFGGATGQTGAQGPEGFQTMIMRNSPPSNRNLYVDDGTNTADGKPHLRHKVNGVWIDL